MRILCNLPLECFDDRAAMRGVELCTFGPPDRMMVDGVHYPFDVAFDPSRQSWHELAAALPDGFAPDLVMIWWPDQEPLPRDLEQCPVPVVGVVSDYNLTLPHLAGLWPFFDSLLCDRRGVELFTRLTFADVRYWCQFAHKRPFHRRRDDVATRDLDVGFVGNLNPVVQRERAGWLDRVRRLDRIGARVEVCGGVHGDDYGRLLNRCRIGWNRSIRGEMNLRAFEVPACGALLLMERDNLEVRDFFVPDEECVLHGDDDFEDVVARLHGDRARTERIAAAGHRRVQDHRLGNRLHELAPLANGIVRRPDSTAADRSLGRAVAMLGTWADGAALIEAAMAAVRDAPNDPRALNLLALATLRWRGADGGPDAFALWQRALAACPIYLPAAVNLATLAKAADDAGLRRATEAERDRRLGAATTWESIDGPMLPFGFDAATIDRSLALQTAIHQGSPTTFVQCVSTEPGQ
ncbi:MAG: glycosyltransferase family 1 protein, partial [Planctomycetes bacterium]|nr:glycosyltransferase family 1 protein [Planctomycetota bacterium]